MSRLQNYLIVLLLLVDSFFLSYAVSLNTRHILVIDPQMKPAAPPVVQPTPQPTSTAPSTN